MEFFMIKAYKTTEEFQNELNSIVDVLTKNIHVIIKNAILAENKIIENNKLDIKEKEIKLERSKKATYNKLLKAYVECEINLYETAVATEKEFTDLYEKRKSLVSGLDKHFVFLHYNNACYEMQKAYDMKMKEAGTIYRKKVFNLYKPIGGTNDE